MKNKFWFIIVALLLVALVVGFLGYKRYTKEEKKGITIIGFDAPTILFHLRNEKKVDILFQESKNPGGSYKEDYICLNTEAPPKVGEINSDYSRLFCNKYFFTKAYHDVTGIVIGGPYHKGSLNIKDCKNSKVKDACYFVTAGEKKDYQICSKIDDDFNEERCIMKVAFEKENLSKCKELPNLEKECYKAFLTPSKITAEKCLKIQNSDQRLGDRCFKLLSYLEKDAKYCTEIISTGTQNQCFQEAIESRDEYKNMEEVNVDCNEEVFSNENEIGECREFIESRKGK